MNLYILRHGIAVDHGSPDYPNDADRPLTPKGERKLQQVTEAMQVMELSFDLILSSPYTRAKQTTEIVAEALDAHKKVQYTDLLTPGGAPRRLVELINALKPVPENVLLSGHEPYLSGMISWLVSGDTGMSVVMKKGGLCKLSVEHLKAGRCASLEWLLTPKQMALMG
ncbi:MAG TPA: phosphohistidine phosphatase SixA [Candidatus Acidoferrum sp.]|nr:phosphohistidine phosphatase SixA [Candidatus Acidoferrum sp.]